METEAKTMTPREAAVRLGIRMDTVYVLIWSKRLPAVKIDGCWQIDAATVEERVSRKNAQLGSMSPKKRKAADAISGHSLVPDFRIGLRFPPVPKFPTKEKL